MNTIPSSEREYLRELAKKMYEYSQLPVMNERRKKWYDVNDCKPSASPIVIMEIGGFRGEYYPPMKCESSLGKDIEFYLRHNIMHHEIVNDDTVIPDFYPVGIQKGFSFLTESKPPKRLDGFAHVPTPLVENLEDFPAYVEKKLNPRWTINKEAYKTQLEVISDILGDTLHVRLWGSCNAFPAAGPLFAVLGTENIFYALADYPDSVKEFMQKLTDGYLAFLAECDEKEAVLPNSENHGIPMASCGFTRELPQPDGNKAVKVKDTWGYMNSQETEGISSDMFHEFFFPYYKCVADRFGMLSYGCCEDQGVTWEKSVSQFSTLRKLSVSAFTDEEYMAEALKGRKIIYHRKPSPNYLTSDAGFDEEAFSEHIAKSVKIARGLPLHISFRDILTIRHDKSRLARAVTLTRNIIEKYYK